MIAIQHEDVDIGRLINEAKRPGPVRSLSSTGLSGTTISREMELEAYEEVAPCELEKIAGDAMNSSNLLHVDIIHRIGRLAVGENILIIVVSAGHRPEAVCGFALYHRGDQERRPDLEERTHRRMAVGGLPAKHGHGLAQKI